MTGRRLWLAAACAFAAVFATRWPFRSHALFSWDSANYALAMVHIDVAAHRPHPPGYLGYVLAARAINSIVHDPNAALVAWNMLATALSVLVLIAFASQTVEHEEHRTRVVLAGAAIMLTSPLLWFYSDIAEIYPSELLVSLLVGYWAWRAIHRQRGAIYWCVVSLACAMLFKMTAALLMLPLAAYAWTRVPSRDQRRSAALLVVLVGVVVAAFLAIQPNLPEVLWTHFVGATAESRLPGGVTATPMKALNRNVRDTLTAAASALGVMNVGGLAVWALLDRRLPRAIDRRLAGLWLVPWLLVFLFIHIGKPGYMVPLLPPVALVLAGFYARQHRGVAFALILAQAAINIAQFVVLTPASEASLGGTTRYSEKTLWQRAATDLQALTFPTAFTIAQSDERLAQLMQLVHTVCPSGDPIVIAGLEPVDWRRVMWYLPLATAVYRIQGRVTHIGTRTDASPLAADGISLRTTCPVIWVTPDKDATEPLKPAGWIPVPHLGGMTPAGTIRLSPNAISMVDQAPAR